MAASSSLLNLPKDLLGFRKQLTESELHDAKVCKSATVPSLLALSTSKGSLHINSSRDEQQRIILPSFKRVIGEDILKMEAGRSKRSAAFYEQQTHLFNVENLRASLMEATTATATRASSLYTLQPSSSLASLGQQQSTQPKVNTWAEAEAVEKAKEGASAPQQPIASLKSGLTQAAKSKPPTSGAGFASFPTSAFGAAVAAPSSFSFGLSTAAQPTQAIAFTGGSLSTATSTPLAPINSGFGFTSGLPATTPAPTFGFSAFGGAWPQPQPSQQQQFSVPTITSLASIVGASTAGTFNTQLRPAIGPAPASSLASSAPSASTAESSTSKPAPTVTYLDRIRAAEGALLRLEQEREARTKAQAQASAPFSAGVHPTGVWRPTREQLRSEPTPEQKERYLEALRKPDNFEHLKAFRFPLEGWELKQLRDKVWLRDDATNWYIRLLRERCEIEKRAWIADTRFWPSVTADSVVNGEVVIRGYNYEFVRMNTSWTSRLKPRGIQIDVFARDLLLFPINYVQSHWACMALDLKNKTAAYYDSLVPSQASSQTKAQNCAKVLLRWLAEEHKTKKWKEGAPLFTTEDWTVVGAYQGVPQQDNGCDCGMFMLLFLDYLSAGFVPVEGRPEHGGDFDQSDIPMFRQRIGVALLEQKLPEVPWNELTGRNLGPRAEGAR